MKPSFTNLEVIKFAIGMEEGGVEFYEAYAKKAKGDVRQLFLKLADDERAHASYFQELFDESKKSETAFDYMFDESVTGFFNEYAKSEGFSREVGKITTVKEALAEGVASEQITIDYYEGMLEYSKGKITQTLEKLIKEEKEHLVKLTNLYNLEQ